MITEMITNKRVKEKRMKKLVYALAIGLTALPALAQEGASAAAGGGYGPLAAGLCIAIAAFGGALGQGKAAEAALSGIARNPAAQNKLFVPMIIALALIESLVIYALIIAFSIKG
jgi:F-type H+-transporting ATPase subunit c